MARAGSNRLSACFSGALNMIVHGVAEPHLVYDAGDSVSSEIIAHVGQQDLREATAFLVVKLGHLDVFRDPMSGNVRDAFDGHGW